jgi:sulfate/thiosulfate transport system substrate-binding protein
MHKWQSGLLMLLVAMTARGKDIQILNVSYDPTREFYQQYNQAFVKFYKQKTGDNVVVRQSHGGSGKQATAVINGIPADVVTLALQPDIDAIATRGRIQPNWQHRLPDNSAPYTSTIVFLVRQGNPKHIHDWDDLTRPGIAVITPNPKTSGGARWNYLAAFGYALDKYHGDHSQAQAFMRALYKNVTVQDTGARAATSSFAERGLGDVLIAWENEAYLALNKLSNHQLQIIIPSESILAEPTVALVDKVVDRRGSRQVAQAYLQYLYSPEGQAIAARNYFRPRDLQIEKRFSSLFKPIKRFTVDEKFNGWAAAQQIHFSEGGSYDQAVKPD